MGEGLGGRELGMVGIDTVQFLYIGMFVVHGKDCVKKALYVDALHPTKKNSSHVQPGILITSSMTS